MGKMGKIEKNGSDEKKWKKKNQKQKELWKKVCKEKSQ